jgi:CelD/BcsL family acetyltransferase involved in cellulose biosynthesis
MGVTRGGFQLSASPANEPQALRIDVFTSLTEAESSWRRCEREGDCWAFQSFDWLADWYRMVGSRQRLDLCLVSVSLEDGEPLLFLPCGVRRRGIGTSLVWLGGEMSDYHGPLLGKRFDELLAREGFGRLWGVLIEHLPRFDYFHFQKQPATIGRQENPFVSLPCMPHALPGCYSQLDADWQTYYKSKRGSKTRATDRRKQRKLEQGGALEFAVCGDAPQADSLVQTMMRQKSLAYGELGVPDLFGVTEHCDFVRHMTRHHVGGLVHLAAVTLDDQVLATHWGLVHRDRFYLLFPAYERCDWTRYSPGNLLLHNLFQWCFANNVQFFDFTLGDEPYKLDWCEHTLPLYDFLAARTTRGRLCVTLVRAGRTAKRRIKSSPRLWSAAQALRRRFVRRRRVL